MECPYIGECKEQKQIVRDLQVKHATIEVHTKNVADCTERIEKSVQTLADSVKNVTNDLYSKYGQVKELIHTEETSRMTADRNIEDKVTASAGTWTSRVITWLISAGALVFSVISLWRK